MTRVITMFLMLFVLLFSSGFGSDQGDPVLPAPEAPAFKAEMQQMPGTFDPLVFNMEIENLNAWLMSESAPLCAAAVISVPVSEREISAIEERSCENCKDAAAAKERFKVGIDKQLGININFSRITLDAISPTGELLANGIMRQSPSGRAVWTIAIESEKASGLQLRLTDLNLPERVKMYIYNLRGEAYGPYSAENARENNEMWTHTVTGSVALLQIHFEAPLSIADIQATHFVIQDLGFLGEKFALAVLKKGPGTNEGDHASSVDEHCTGWTADCIEDASCYDSSDWAPIESAKYSIAHILYNSGGSWYICSGGLIADTEPAVIEPYFLTANHCVSTQTVANTVRFYWQFWTASCHGACYYPYSGAVPQTLGCDVLRTSSTQSDFSLLLMDHNPPAGSVFMGWDTEQVATDNNQVLYRLSHPQGAPLAYSKHRVDTSSPQCTGWPRGRWIYSKDILGATEGGSSGSPVFNEAGYIVGELTGSCGYNINDPCDYINNWTADGAIRSYFSLVSDLLVPSPIAPSNLTLRASCTSIRLTWRDNSANEEEFRIERSTNGTDFTFLTTVPANQTNYTDSGLPMNTRYWYRVQACNETGCSTYSNIASARTLRLPVAPVDLCAELADHNTVVLTWRYENSEFSSSHIAPAEIDAFLVYRGPTLSPASISAHAETNMELIAKVHPKKRDYKDPEVRPGRYYYKVCAVNACGETCSEIVRIAVE